MSETTVTPAQPITVDDERALRRDRGLGHSVAALIASTMFT